MSPNSTDNLKLWSSNEDPPPPWLEPARSGGKDLPQASEVKEKFELDEPEARNLTLTGNLRGVRDEDERDNWKHRKQNIWRLIILYQHNLGILLQAVDGYRRASDIMAPNLIVIDNSETKDAFASVRLQSIVKEVLVTPQQLNFPQLHNYMADLAVERNLLFFFWAHADNYVLPMSPQRDLGKDVIECMRGQVKKSPNWGMLLFSYDHLAAYRTQTMAQVPWDPLIFQYGSECDVSVLPRP